MGIGNTTAAAALLSALTGHPTNVTVGRGTGVDDETFARKCAVVDTALRRHIPGTTVNTDTRELLRHVGGLELAAIAGAAIEAAQQGIAVVADGFISTVAILCAVHMEAQTSGSHDGDTSKLSKLGRALFFAHRSAERGHTLALEACATEIACDTTPLLDLGMRLGEGSGAALSMPILRAAAAVMRDMATFESASVSQAEVYTDKHIE
jgi:nicotinate-nucleotide--dimethylbenzimidazole phosphoribosyltransferase